MSSNIPEHVRTAIWLAWDGCCAIDHKPIGPGEYHIDHIIPQWVWRDPAENRRIFTALGLPDSASPDDLDNLRPIRTRWNQEKGDQVYPDEQLIALRGKSAQKAPKVRELIAQLESGAATDKIVSQAAARATLDPGARAKLEAALEGGEFPSELYITDDFVRISRSRVCVQCHLPSFRHERKGSGLITFRTVRLHHCLVAISHEQILRLLLQGNATPPSVETRPFLMAPSHDSDDWYINLDGTTLILTKAETAQLCEVVDLLAPLYREAAYKLIEEMGTTGFPMMENGDVRLIRVSRYLWSEMVRFTHAFDVMAGETPLHVFSPNSFRLQIRDRNATEHASHFAAYVYPKTSDRAWADYTRPDHGVDLCWDASGFCQSFTESYGWTAECTAEWLTQTMIPAVLKWRQEQDEPTFWQKLFGRGGGNSEDPAQCYEPLRHDTFAVFDAITTVTELTTWVERVQQLYHGPGCAAVPAAIVDAVTNGLFAISDQMSGYENQLHYISGNFGGACMGSSLREMVAYYRQDLGVQPVYTSWVVDMLLRGACAALRHGRAKDQEEVCVQTIKRHWQPLNDHFESAMRRERLLQSA